MVRRRTLGVHWVKYIINNFLHHAPLPAQRRNRKIVAGQPMNRSLFTMEGIPRGIEKYLLGWHRDEDASIRNPTRVEVRAEPKYGPEVLLLTLVNEGGERQMPFVCFGEEQV